MWEAVGKLFDDDKAGLNESDMKYAVEKLLRDWLKSNEVRCERVESGRVVVRVLSPALRQEVLMRESQLKVELKKQHDYQMNKLLVSV